MDTLRSVIQPMTHNLPAPMAEAGRNLLTPFCYKALIMDVDPFTHQECLKLAVSKALGIGIISASAIVKVPQLIKLLQSRSSAGISFLSYLLESAAYLISLAYNVRLGFPFSTYGETSLILIQNIAIAAAVLHFRGQPAGAALWVAGLAAAGYALFASSGIGGAELINMKQLAMLQAGAGVLGVASKVPQILTIFQEGSTGQLSAFAVFNYLAGSASRIFTTLAEVPDPLILYGFVAGFALNALLAAQMVYYWNSAPAAKPKKSGGKAQKKGGPRAEAAQGEATGAQQQKVKSPTTRRRG